MPTSFTLPFTATPADIDDLGHVNNAVWVRWTQEVAVAHWHAKASPEHRARYVSVVTRHEVDYLRPLGLGERLVARTWVDGPPRGARFDRRVEFTGESGRVHVRALTIWAILDVASGRPIRIPPEMAAPFLAPV